MATDTNPEQQPKDPNPYNNPKVYQPLLDSLLRAEAEVDTIQRKALFKVYHPQAFEVLEQIRSLINLAYIKINEGDDKK